MVDESPLTFTEFARPHFIDDLIERSGVGLDGANCRAAEKVRRLDEWLAHRQLGDAVIWAYGDSDGDRELLARADHPLLVKGFRVPSEPIGVGR